MRSMHSGLQCGMSFANAGASLRGEVEVHMLRALFHLVQQRGIGRADDAVDLLNLVQLVGAREEREEGHNLEKHAPEPHMSVCSCSTRP